MVKEVNESYTTQECHVCHERTSLGNRHGLQPDMAVSEEDSSPFPRERGSRKAEGGRMSTAIPRYSGKDCG